MYRMYFPAIRKRKNGTYTVTLRDMVFKCNCIARAIYLSSFLQTKNNINLP